MGSITFNPIDVAKYGIPETVEFDLKAFGVRQRAAVEKATGHKATWMFDQLSGVPELDEHGNAIPVPVLDDDDNPVLDEDGNPKVTEKLTRDPEALAMFVWMVLWGAGHRLDWNAFDVCEVGLKVRIVDDEDEPEGKDDAPTTDSANTTSESTSPTG
jgi:hypothetical protein